NGRLEERQAVAILADVARALCEAHARGIVHRDIKPTNILLVREPGGPADAPGGCQVKLSDFRLARHGVESESLQLTQAVAGVGAPLYMAPEQASSLALDPRADVYAMGATLFHMLTGRPPFLGPTTLALLQMHRDEPPPPLRKLDPKLSDAVCRLVERCLAKAPGERYTDAGALLVDLERQLRGEPAHVGVHPILPASESPNLLRYE